MPNQEFFIQRPPVTPTIYAYSLPDLTTHEGYIKVGYTGRDAKTRVEEQVGTSGLRYKILLAESAIRSDGTVFSDRDVHNLLESRALCGCGKAAAANGSTAPSGCKDRRRAAPHRHCIRRGPHRDIRNARNSRRRRKRRNISGWQKRMSRRAPKFLWNA